MPLQIGKDLMLLPFWKGARMPAEMRLSDPEPGSSSTCSSFINIVR